MCGHEREAARPIVGAASSVGDRRHLVGRQRVRWFAPASQRRAARTRYGRLTRFTLTKLPDSTPRTSPARFWGPLALPKYGYRTVLGRYPFMECCLNQIESRFDEGQPSSRGRVHEIRRDPRLVDVLALLD